MVIIPLNSILVLDFNNIEDVSELKDSFDSNEVGSICEEEEYDIDSQFEYN